MKRKTLRTLFLAAVTALGVCRTAHAALFVDLQVTSVTGPAQMYGPQNVIITGPGAQLEIDLFARIADHANDPYSLPALQRLSGSLMSIEAPGYDQPGTLEGTIQTTLVDNFGGPDASIGTQVDLDGDGDLDVGGTNPNSRDDYFTADVGFGDGYYYPPKPGRVFKVGHLSFIVDSITSAPLAAAVITFQPLQSDVGALWIELGQMKTPLNGEFVTGLGVSVSALPEPGPLALLSAVATFASALRPQRKR
jgi:hypothetical protein